MNVELIELLFKAIDTIVSIIAVIVAIIAAKNNWQFAPWGGSPLSFFHSTITEKTYEQLFLARIICFINSIFY